MKYSTILIIGRLLENEREKEENHNKAISDFREFLKWNCRSLTYKKSWAEVTDEEVESVLSGKELEEYHELKKAYERENGRTGTTCEMNAAYEDFMSTNWK